MLFVALCCFLLHVFVFGACFHLQSVAFCCSSLLCLVFEIESILSQNPKQTNAFCCSLWLSVGRFVFSGCFYLSVALLVEAFVGMKNQNEQQKATKVQIETRPKYKPATLHESNLCFSKSSEKLQEMTKNFLDKNHEDFCQEAFGKFFTVFWTTYRKTLKLTR